MQYVRSETTKEAGALPPKRPVYAVYVLYAKRPVSTAKVFFATDQVNTASPFFPETGNEDPSRGHRGHRGHMGAYNIRIRKQQSSFYSRAYSL